MVQPIQPTTQPPVQTTPQTTQQPAQQPVQQPLVEKKKSKWWIWLILAVVFLVIAVGIFFWLF